MRKNSGRLSVINPLLPRPLLLRGPYFCFPLLSLGPYQLFPSSQPPSPTVLKRGSQEVGLFPPFSLHHPSLFVLCVTAAAAAAPAGPPAPPLPLSLTPPQEGLEFM